MKEDNPNFTDNKLLPLCMQKAQFSLYRKSKTYGINMEPVQSNFHQIIPSLKLVSKLFKY